MKYLQAYSLFLCFIFTIFVLVIVLNNWGKLGGCFRKAQLLFLKSSAAQSVENKTSEK
jgi:hypothetical protein